MKGKLSLVSVLTSLTLVVLGVIALPAWWAEAESYPWGVTRIGADVVHGYNLGGGVKVAILDCFAPWWPPRPDPPGYPCPELLITQRGWAKPCFAPGGIIEAFDRTVYWHIGRLEPGQTVRLAALLEDSGVWQFVPADYDIEAFAFDLASPRVQQELGELDFQGFRNTSEWVIRDAVGSCSGGAARAIHTCWLNLGLPHDPNDKQVIPEGDVQPGDQLNYTVNFENTGDGAAFDVYITDTLDPNLDEATVVINDGGVYDELTRTILWDIGLVPAHEGGSVTFSANVQSDVGLGTAIFNYATVFFPTVDEETPTNMVYNVVPLPNDPPIADAGPDQTVMLGSNVILTGLAVDPDSQPYPITYGWFLGSVPSESALTDADIIDAQSLTPQFTPDKAGDYVVTLAVSDGAAADYDDVTITVTSTINTPPVADANGPYSGTAGVAVVFDGSGSYDADGDALTYVWDFGDGFTGTGVSPIHAYAAGGVYTVTLVVSDGKENSSPSVTTATINTPPVADANGPYSGTVGLLVIFEGSGSSDADGDPLSYSWDFGDGGTGSGVTPSHTYAAGGVYTVTLIVNDGKIDSATSTATANINTPPVANANGPYFGTVGILLNFDGSGSFDADGDPLTYSWDFGDGETGSGESPSHTYALGGVYTVTLIVNDGKIDSTPSTTTATINTPPVADANGPYIEPATSWDGAWVDLDGSESYDPDGDTLTFVWKIGDHEIGTGAMLTYQFPFGETEVSLTVTDPSEASDTATTTVMVTLIDVEIDIKPGSYPNSINLGSNGVVPVAFLTDGGFDAATIDPSTITLAGHDFSGLVRMRGKGGQTPLASLEDVDADGDLDLVVQLETENLTLEPTDTICVLGALTFDGWVVQGEDTVRIVPE